MDPTTVRRLAVTGAAGALGGLLRAELARRGLPIRSIDLREPAQLYTHESFVRCDLADGPSILDALRDVDAVVHLGGISTLAPFDNILAANVVGSFHVFEAARIHRIGRVVYASSNHVTGFYPSTKVVSAEMPHRPDSFYGLSKAFGEDLAQLYWDKYGVESVGLRIGSCFEKPTDQRMLKTWLSHADFLRLVDSALRAPSVGHTIVYGVSDNPAQYWTHGAANTIGFVAQDTSATYAEALKDAAPEPPFQGGGFNIVDETTLSG